MSNFRTIEETEAHDQRLDPGWKLVVAFTLTYLAFAIPAAIQYSTEFVIYSVEMVLLCTVIAIIHARFRLNLVSLWCLSLCGLSHLSGGLVHVPETWNTQGANLLYNLWLIPGWLKYDQAVHFLGFGVATWVAWQILCRITGVIRPTPELLIISVATSMGLGSLNEVVEFIATVMLPVTNIGDYSNYGWDLVPNASGAILASIVIYCWKCPNISDNPL